MRSLYRNARSGPLPSTAPAHRPQLIEINAVNREAANIRGMKALLIVNDPPYGSERLYNALRLAHALLKNDAVAQITVFLMADAVLAAKARQKTPEGYYNVERMLKRVLSGKGAVLLCGTCMDARGLTDAELLDGASRSTMDQLASTVIEADKVFVF
jgi:uncharacterized protein involved in oxidation of intracellular sulfur